MRNFFNKFGYYIVAGAVVIVVIILYRHVSTDSVLKRTDDFSAAFYVDEDTGEESVRPITDVPPLMGASGKPTVVRAIKYSCGGKSPEVLYFFKYTDTVQVQLQALPLNDPVADLRRADLIGKGQLVRAPAKDSEWVPQESEKGQELIKLPTCPDGKSAKIIYPQKR